MARLAAFEKRWAEALFAAILAPETAGLPAFASIDRTAFWRCIEDAPGPLFGVGLRGMVHLLTFLPLAEPPRAADGGRGARRPFFALPSEAQRAYVAALEHDPRFVVRQALHALKMVACMAWFDAPSVRARFAGAAL
ncbi:MAG: hypothetical protein U1F43_32970 [Myxococcota bacterium]